jgi:outer membrane receptor protein involved in Fe transport
MKKLLLLALCCYLSIAVFAQTAPPTFTVKGIAIDSATNKPLGYATVMLLDAKTQQSVKGGLTKDDGSFELKSVQGKDYQLTIASVGYKNKVVNIKNAPADVDAGKLLLTPSNNELKEVSITAIKPLMKQEVDRISYDVAADPESKALDALDMIRKVPLLSVDANDNIKLKGSGNYKILINGKESALVAKNPSDVLKSMPATNIVKIEVITTPPAKYDAEGLAGIINIITKKNADQGYNATINTRYNSVFGPGLNINGNAKQGKFGVTMYAGGSQTGEFSGASGNLQRIFGGQSTNQYGVNTNKFRNRYGNVELSYEIDSLNLLTGSFEIFHGHGDQTGDMLSNTTNYDGSLAQRYLQTSSGYNTFEGMDASLNYQIGFKRSKDQLLTLSYKYSYSPNTQYNDNAYTQRMNDPESAQPDFRQYNNAGSKEHTIQVDYAEPIDKKITLEAGTKAILRNNYSNFNRSDRDSASSEYVPNPAYTDNFKYLQDVYSVYNSYQFKMDKWTAKAGLRLEHTTVDADFTSAQTKVNQDYNNLIPSISIQRSFKTSSLNLGFTQRIQRPGIYQLNPFVDNSNPKFISTGNPNLKPELNNTFEFTYSNFSKNSFTAGLSYQFSNNSIQNVSSLKIDSTNNGTKDTVTTTTFQNLGSNRTLGLNVNANIAFTKKLTLSLNGLVSKVWLRGTYNGQFYENSGITGNAFGNLGYKFDFGFRAGINVGFFSGDVNLQGRSNNYIYNAVVLSQEFFKKKLTISLVANNPESKYHTFTSTTTTPEYYQYYFNQNPYRTFAIRASFKIGKLNSEVKKNQHGINNDDTKGGGKSSGGNG